MEVKTLSLTFHVSEDKINVSDLLVGSETIDDLLSDISASIDNNDIELVIQLEIVVSISQSNWKMWWINSVDLI